MKKYNSREVLNLKNFVYEKKKKKKKKKKKDSHKMKEHKEIFLKIKFVKKI